MSGLVLAIDPGVSWHGWCLLACVEGGQWEPVRYGHSDLERVCSEIHGGVTVAVETPAGHAYSAARVKGLLEAAGAAGELRATARERGAEVVRCSAETWRAALVGRAAATDEQIAEALRRHATGGRLRALPSGLPKSELVHVLDALGLALIVATRGADWVERREEERRARATRQQTLPGLGTKRRRVRV